MHAVSASQIAAVLHFNDNHSLYSKPFWVNCKHYFSDKQSKIDIDHMSNGTGSGYSLNVNTLQIDLMNSDLQ